MHVIRYTMLHVNNIEVLNLHVTYIYQEIIIESNMPYDIINPKNKW